VRWGEGAGSGSHPGIAVVARDDIPDHTLSMSCDAPWHTGMAWALGYMGAAIKLIQEG
jgi:hypothetical protein